YIGAATKTTHLSGIHDTCRRTVEPGVTGNFTFNISSAGLCDSLLNESGKSKAPELFVSLASIMLVLFLSCVLVR
ncbi:uncharacterized protein CEXT_50891, partial [Caerostris extrusa]